MGLFKSQKSGSSKLIRDIILSKLAESKKGHTYCGNPVTVESPHGKAILFDGIDDGIFIPENPVTGLTSFTIEVIMRPDAGGPAEQRFVHIGETDSDRILLETRPLDSGWYLDTFILSGQNKTALIDPARTHPFGQWYNVTMTLDENGTMTNYVNGSMEMKGHIEFHALNTGLTSIGVRQNKISWYKGAICRIRISRGILEPDKFIKA